MSSHYQVLKGTVSQLIVYDDEEEMRSDHIGLINLIGIIILSFFEVIVSTASALGSLTCGSIKIAGQGFCCYIGSKWGESKLVGIGFKDGDYIEAIVEPQKDNTYKTYAVRVPQQHAYFFPRSVGTTTLHFLKYCSIFSGGFSVVILSIGLLIEFFSRDFLNYPCDLFWFFIFVFILLIFIFFFMFGGHYSFLSNKIYAIWGYPKPWLFNSVKENLQFKKMNRDGDPILFDDPQTPDFKKLIKYSPYADYYCRTPILPDWVTVLDERGKHPKNDVVIIRDET
ncbi:hypothetical protein [Gilliamella sp. A7]|uniref:hypothetical protein n=1 Tax=Gilliamella sp. A7 TaxID=1970465 RepID=UPI000A33D9C5|nr:hypothetical protein [Gilliamella sp. A7]OTQ59388.1 hypothetical protein B6D18_04175 [Gilliamella sp. A7]